MYIVTFKGQFGFIKPWTAVRDGETFSQLFLTPSIIEGMEKKLFPDQLYKNGVIERIKRHKLSYDSMNAQQEVTQPRGWIVKKTEMTRPRSVLKRNVLLNPKLTLAFATYEDALIASRQHLCLCRNEDIVLPDPEILEMTDEEFSSLDGFELRFGENAHSFLVGYNRFSNNKPMYGWIEFNGQSLK